MRLQPMLSPADTLPLYLCLYVILSYSEQPLSKQSSRAEFISFFFFFFCNIEYFNLLQVHLQYTQQKYLRRLLEISLQTFNFFDQKFLRHSKTIKISVYNWLEYITTEISLKQDRNIATKHFLFVNTAFSDLKFIK